MYRLLTYQKRDILTRQSFLNAITVRRLSSGCRNFLLKVRLDRQHTGRFDKLGTFFVSHVIQVFTLVFHRSFTYSPWPGRPIFPLQLTTFKKSQTVLPS